MSQRIKRAFTERGRVRFKPWVWRLAILGALLAFPPPSQALPLTFQFSWNVVGGFSGSSPIDATLRVFDIDPLQGTYLINFSGSVANPDCCTIPGGFAVANAVDLTLNPTSNIEILNAIGSPGVFISSSPPTLAVLLHGQASDLVAYTSSSWSVTAEVFGMAIGPQPNGVFLLDSHLEGLRDSSGKIVLADGGEALLVEGSFNVPPGIPEPSAALLFGVGAVVVGRVVTWRRQA